MKGGVNRAFTATLATYLLSLIIPSLAAPSGRTVVDFTLPFDLAAAAAGTTPAAPAKKNGDFYERIFEWSGVDKNTRQVTFIIPKANIKDELRLFGVPRGSEHPLILQKKGYKQIGIDVFIVNYQEIFLRNLGYFAALTESLYAAARPQPAEACLHEFLVFVQHIKYERPPAYYNNKFILSFFPPIVCLYERYGDCDSKSVLLATFLTRQNEGEKTALLLIRSMGLNHALLAVKRNPLPGMSALFVSGKGYYIPLETSGPGWAPGFVSNRIWSMISTGSFLFYDLQ